MNVTLIIIVAASVIVGYVSSRFLPPNSPIEQLAEEEIKLETGITVDFSADKTKV